MRTWPCRRGCPCRRASKAPRLQDCKGRSPAALCHLYPGKRPFPFARDDGLNDQGQSCPAAMSSSPAIMANPVARPAGASAFISIQQTFGAPSTPSTSFQFARMASRPRLTSASARVCVVTRCDTRPPRKAATSGSSLAVSSTTIMRIGTLRTSSRLAEMTRRL